MPRKRPARDRGRGGGRESGGRDEAPCRRRWPQCVRPSLPGRPRACRSSSTLAPMHICRRTAAIRRRCWRTRSSAAGCSSTRGVASVFVVGRLDEPTVAALVDGIGKRRVSVIAAPGSPPTARLAELGVARVSFGPFTRRATLTHLADLAADLYAGAALPSGIRPLN